MDYEITTLKSGIKLLTVPMPSLESVSMIVWVGVGSRHEPSGIAGISHFLEHMTFQGSKNYKNAQRIAEAFDQIGAEHNAATSQEWTNFYVKVKSDNLGKAFGILADCLQGPVFSKEDIEKERGSIIEEIAMFEDAPMEKVGDYFNELVFKGNSLGRDIAGSPQTVSSIKRQDFLSFRDKHYVSNNMAITVAGNFDKSEVGNLCESKLAIFAKGTKESPERFVSIQKSPQIFLKNKKSEQAHLIVGFQGYPRSHKFHYSEILLSTILGRGASSRMFDEIRWKRGLAYAVYTSSVSYADTGSFETYVGSDVGKIDEVIKLVLQVYKSVSSKAKSIKRTEFEKAKEFIKGHIALSLEDTENAAGFFGERLIGGEEVLTPEQIYKKIDKVDLQGIYEVADDLFRNEKLNMAIIGPYDNQKRFEKYVL
jgi:predicted Zn-dependent peptidase